MKMNVSIYLRKGIVYVPTVRQIPLSYSRETEPVRVCGGSDLAAIAGAIEQVAKAGNPSVSPDELSKYPNWLTVVPAGVTSWSAFARGATTWFVGTRGPKANDYIMHGYIAGKGGAWTPDPVPLFELPADTPIAELAMRAAEIVHEAAKRQSQTRA